MQAVKQGQSRTTITISNHIKERVVQKKRGNQTYDDVLENLLDIADIRDSESADGIIFLYSVSIDGDLKKLKEPIKLLLHKEDDGTIDLANDEYKILVSCDSLGEALEDAGIQFAENLSMFSKPNLSESSRRFGDKLRNAVWM